MKLSTKLLEELQNRLKVGNRRGVHLNAIPNRSRYKFDLNQLSILNKTLPKNFIDQLLSILPFKFKLSFKTKANATKYTIEQQEKINAIERSFENLINQVETIELEKGINTFGFGFPILIKKSKQDKKIIAAPILIWSLTIKKDNRTNTWIISRTDDDPIYVNEILINYLQTDSKIQIDKVAPEMLEDGVIDKKELVDICFNILKNLNGAIDFTKKQFLSDCNKIKGFATKAYYDNKIKNTQKSLIEFTGLFSIFEVQKQSIIEDYTSLIKKQKVLMPFGKFDIPAFQSISSIQTDPTQQNILNSINHTRNILIQGSPGTGKSQTLTAILVNALENSKKVLVVCEKRTALEVLYNAMINKGLGDNCILIKDETKDRRKVVNSVRQRVDPANYKSEYIGTPSNKYLKTKLKTINSIIERINTIHQDIGKLYFEDENWTAVVGNYLSALRRSKEDFRLQKVSDDFVFKLEELTDLRRFAKAGQFLYTQYSRFADEPFFNTQKLLGSNAQEILAQIEADFNFYRNEIVHPTATIPTILHQYNDISALYHQPTFAENVQNILLSIFSKKKRVFLKNQQQFQEAINQLWEKIKADNWLVTYQNNVALVDRIHEIMNILDQKDQYFNNDNYNFEAEYNWLNFYHQLSSKQKRFVQALKNKENWEHTLHTFYLHKLLLKKVPQSASLQFIKTDYQNLEYNLKAFARMQLDFIQNHWWAKQMKKAKAFYQENNNNISVENLYNKRKSKKHKRHSVRQIVQYDTELFTTFFPVILTTPSVCSTIFKTQNQYFDIVLFDEASQLRLEDNLPALLKGKQIIIAGDEHQMPPSNYFSKIYEGTKEDEIEEEEEYHYNKNNALLACESLLDFAVEMNFEKRYLDFHYRSKHPYLIDFSNHAFYNQRLKPLPNTTNYIPIHFLQVDGIFDARQNIEEAKAVIKILKNDIKRLPNKKYPSIGIATFSITQRNLIKRQISNYSIKSAIFSKKINALEEAGLFVKNLENIQGDERDIIILSTTYGKKKNGKFAQRFGPINFKKGYKLLNVIITRAKHQCYVCTSIPETVFLNYEAHLRTEGANNRRAVFYSYLAYAKAVSEGDEAKRLNVLKALSKNTSIFKSHNQLNNNNLFPFETEVYQMLLEHFDYKSLKLHYKFGGFEIDILYDPPQKNSPKVIIECDGTKEHNSREAYLFDHHREKILTQQGFIFYRIWSVDWWKNRERAISELINFLRTRK